MSDSSGLAGASQPTAFTTETKGNDTIFRLAGIWTVHTLPSMQHGLQAETQKSNRPVIIDLSEVSRLDTAGALALNEIIILLKNSGRQASIAADNEHFQKLLGQSQPVVEEKKAPSRKDSYASAFFRDVGRNVCSRAVNMGQFVGFIGLFLVTLVTILARPSKIRGTSLVWHMEQTGLRAVPIVCLLTFLIGVVVAYMGSDVLAQFGAQIFGVKLLEVTILREMGILITAIVVAGRSSSSFTAQIGSMMANQEVSALRSMGLNPMELLVMPRIMALIISMPILVFLSNLSALFGGAVAFWATMDLSFTAFVSRLHEAITMNNFLVGMIKTPVCGFCVGIVGCYQGFKASGSAESVGFLTTVAVVQAIFAVIMVDALFALFFTSIGM